MDLKYYRFYFLTPQNQIFRFVEADCRDDTAAKSEAEKLLAEDVIEIWHQGRKVGRLDPAEYQQHRLSK
jgi:hypothetical protein